MQSLEARPEEIPAFGRHYDADLIDTKIWKWLHWTIPLILERPATDGERAAMTAFADFLKRVVAEAPERLAHRDFKAENLHVVGEPLEAARLVVIDVQGAFLAPPEYDLACFLFDLQTIRPDRELDGLAGEAEAAFEAAGFEPLSRERLDALALARLCKDVSHVVHAAHVRGDRRRLHELPRGLELIRGLAGRREHTFPGARVLTSVTQALTTRIDSSDSPR